jgi:hypothetical protein
MVHMLILIKKLLEIRSENYISIKKKKSTIKKLYEKSLNSWTVRQILIYLLDLTLIQ